MHVQPREQMAVVGAGLPPPLVGQRQQERHRRVAERLRRGARDRPRHVGDAIVQNAVDGIDRVLMGGRVAGFKTAALVDCHIHQRRPRFQLCQLRARNQLGCRSPGDQHRADDQVGLRRKVDRGRGIGKSVVELRAEHVIQIAQTRDRPVEHRHIRAHARRDPGRMGADDPAAQHQHLCRQHPRHAAQQHPAPAIGLLQGPGPDLRGKAACHLGHRRQQRQPAPVVGHCFIGDGGDARRQQVCGLFGVGGEVQVGEQHLPRAQTLAFGRLRFLDLDHQIGGGKDLFGRGQDHRARRGIVGVRKARADTGGGFDIDLMAVVHRFARGIGRQTDAVFLRLDLFGATDFH